MSLQFVLDSLSEAGNELNMIVLDACRDRNYTYSGSNNAGDVAWFKDNSGSSTHAVGTKQSNRLGLYDMSGNVWEWCWDRKGDYASGTQTDPGGAAAGGARVLRGGCWLDGASSARSAYRSLNYPNHRYYSIGFRLVRP